jgi:hypothetical protein
MKLTPSYLVIETGAEVEANGYEDCEGDAIKKLLVNFAQVINGEPDIKAVSPVESHLDVMAVIDTAYLSARTGMPEHPEKITQISNSRANRIVNTKL